MEATIQIDPVKYSERSLRLILAKAEEWKCTPGEALVRLLDSLASRAGFKPRTEPGTEGRAA